MNRSSSLLRSCVVRSCLVSIGLAAGLLGLSVLLSLPVRAQSAEDPGQASAEPTLDDEPIQDEKRIPDWELAPGEEEPSAVEVERTYEAEERLREGLFPRPGVGLSFAWYGLRILDFYAQLDWAGPGEDGEPTVRASTVEAVGDSFSVQIDHATYTPGEQTVEDLLCALKFEERELTSERCPELRELYATFRPESLLAALPAAEHAQAREITVRTDGETVEVAIVSGKGQWTKSKARDPDLPLFEWAVRATQVLRACIAATESDRAADAGRDDQPCGRSL